MCARFGLNGGAILAPVSYRCARVVPQLFGAPPGGIKQLLARRDLVAGSCEVVRCERLSWGRPQAVGNHLRPFVEVGNQWILVDCGEGTQRQLLSAAPVGYALNLYVYI